MNNKKRIFALLALAVLIIAVAVTVIAETAPEYTGNVTTMNNKLAIIDEAENLSDAKKAIDEAAEYLEKIDPAADGYAALVEALDCRELLFADAYLDTTLAESGAASKHKSLDSLAAYLAEHPFADTTAVTVNDNGTPEDTSDDTVLTAGAFKAKLAVGKTAIAEAYLEEAKAAEAPAEKHVALDGLATLEADYAPSHSSVYNLTAVQNENFACAQLYLSEVRVSEGTAKSGAALRRFRGFVADHPFPDTVDGYAAFATDLASKTSAYEAAIEKAKAEAELLAHVGDYAKKAIVNLDFNGESSVNRTGSLTPENYLENNEPFTFIGEDSGFDGTNGYYTVRYERTVHSRTKATIPDTITDSVVFECDFTTFDHLPSTNIWFENGSTSVNGVSLKRTYITVTPDGNIIDAYNKVILEDAIVPGQWIHIGLVINQITNDLDIYLDYEHVATVALAHADGYTSEFIQVRIGANPANSGVAGGSYSIDNVKLYQGFAPRAFDNYATYSNEEKFIYCTEQLTNTDLSFAARREYYQEGLNYLSSFWDGTTYRTTNVAVRAAVDNYLEYADNSYDSLIESLSNENLEKLSAVVSKLKSYDIGEGTYNSRAYFLAKADSIIALSGSYITRNESYDECSAAISAVRNQLAKEDALLGFIEAVDDFYAAATISDMTVYNKEANDLLADIDVEMATGGNFPSFDAAYTLYLDMATVLADEITVDNSKMLLACLTFIDSYDTEEKWDANYEYLKTYVKIARSIINEGNYDPYYRDVGDLVDTFEPMSAYFFVRMQTDYINHLTDELARHDASDAYFEKYGILVKLKDYISENDIDLTNETIISLVKRIEDGLVAIESERESYDELLNTNTEKFVEKCKGLVGAIGYVDMKRICDEAAVYYHAMNVTSAAAQDAIAVYSRRTEELEAIEANAESFVLAVSIFDLPETDVLETIVFASQYLAGLEESCDGVADALKRYNTETAIFNAKVEKGNAEILSVAKGATALSNNGERDSLVTVIMSNINKE